MAGVAAHAQTRKRLRLGLRRQLRALCRAENEQKRIALAKGQMPTGEGNAVHSPPRALLVKTGIDIVHVLLIQSILGKPQPLAEALEVYDLTRPQEFDDIVDVGIVG